MFSAFRQFRPGLRSPVLWVILAGSVRTAGVVVAGPGPGPNPKHVDNFLGLWEGFDPLDGSPVRLSLTDVDNDGVMAHTLQEDFYTVCFELGAGYSQGRGVVNGTATAISKDVLEVNTELTCISDNNVPYSFG